MRISIIIPSYNEEKYLGATLTRIQEAIQVYGDKDNVEIIVSDNGSTDQTGDIAEQYGALVVSEPNRQIARARNAGARKATGEYLIFTDADTLINRNIIKRVDELLSDEKIIGGGAFAVFDQYWDAKLISRMINYCCLLFNKSWGAFLYCKRETFEAIGGFDESLYGLEEVVFASALSKKARTAGMKFKIISDMTNVTSARRLGSRWQVLKTRLPFVWRTRSKIRDRKKCGPIWYDVDR